jgi:hypothetical protein
MTNNKITEKEALDLAWKYLQQHAQQRISYFNFFIAFQALMTTGLLTTFTPEFRVHIVGVGIGLLQTLFSYVFWKIDERNKYLTKHGESAIKELERRFYFVVDDQESPNPIRLFTSEEINTDLLRENQKGSAFWKKQISHSKSFNILFIVFGSIGILGAISSAIYHFAC